MLLQKRDLKDAVATLLPLEKQPGWRKTRLRAPECLAYTTLCSNPTDGFETAIATVTMLAKRRSALQTPILKMVQRVGTPIFARRHMSII